MKMNDLLQNQNHSCLGIPKKKMKEKSGLTNVVLADKKNAKLVKTILKGRRILDDRYRMCPSVNDSSCIAIPILESQNLALDEILGVGKQVCPFSSRVLGNKNELYSSFHSERQLNSVQQIVFDTLLEAHHHEKTVQEYVEYILSLSREQCPSKLQRIGDDQTLLIPPNAFQFFDSADTEELFYQKLAQTHQSSRIVRKHPNGISPDSPIRESKTQIVWPPKLVNLQKQQSNPLEKNKNSKLSMIFTKLLSFDFSPFAKCSSDFLINFLNMKPNGFMI